MQRAQHSGRLAGASVPTHKVLRKGGSASGQAHYPRGVMASDRTPNMGGNPTYAQHSVRKVQPASARQLPSKAAVRKRIMYGY